MLNQPHTIRKLISLASMMVFVALLSCLNSEDEGPDFNTQLTTDLNLIDVYLAENGIVAEADDNDLIRYVVHTTGSGERPTLDSCITTHFLGQIMENEKPFTEETNFSFPLSGKLIEGWKVMLPLMREGDSVTVYIPSVLAYGYNGQPLYNIPPNTNVTFGIKLIRVATRYSTSVAPAGSCN